MVLIYILYNLLNVQFEAETLGTVVQITDLGFEMNLTLPQNQGLKATLRAKSTSGDVFTSSIVAPQGEAFPFGNLTSTAEVGVAFKLNGNQVLLNLTSFNITLEAPYTSDINPNLDGLTIYRLLGSLVLTGVAGCDPSACFPNGRCAVDDDGFPICECSCGWSGPNCTVSSGFCSAYGNYAISSDSCPNASTSTLPYLPSLSQRDCNPMFEYRDSTLGICDCKEGWEGPRCEACSTNNACSELYNGEEAECSSSILYYSNTVFLSYTCDLEGTGLENTIVPDTFYVTCNTTRAAAGEPSTNGVYCVVNFVMQEFPDNPITCKASRCSFRDNMTDVNCKSTSCECENDCPELGGIFETIEGRPAVMSCEESNVCTFDIENFFVKLTAPCETRSCLVKGYSFEDGSFEVTRNLWLNPFLASIPLLVLVCIAGFLLSFIVYHRSLYFAPVKVNNTVLHGAYMQANNKQGLHLEFHDLNVVICGSRTVLCDVSGVACAGELTGIMGPSGSGKTTLISCLSQRSMYSEANVMGAVLFGGHVLKESDAKLIGYCPQDSILLPTLTVYETILYSAILRLPSNTSVSNIHDIVQGSVNAMGLEHVQKSYIGGSGRIRGISGGERRRVSVAMEIVTSPKIVLLDEPTSGLDSSSAKNVTSALKTLSKAGCVVVASIHQPPPTVFNMFDKVILLANGHCMYDGRPDSVEPFFNNYGHQRPPGDGIAEFMLECASNTDAIDKIVSTKRGTISKKSEDAELNPDIEDQIYNAQKHDEDDNDPLAKMSSEYTRNPVARELATLAWRTILDMTRNPSLILLHWLLALGMGIFAGCVFYQVGLDTSGAQNRAGGLIFCLAFFGFTSLTTVDGVFQEKTIVSREVDSGYYRKWTYVISKLMLDGFLLRFLPILLFSAPFYPMMGLLSGSSNVALFLMTLGTFAITVGALSLAITFSCSTPGQASFLMNIILLICLLNSGFFVNVEEMPDWISWMRYISAFFYGYAVLITNEVSSLLFNFVVEGYTAVENVRGTTFLGILGVDASKVRDYIIILDCMYVIYALLALFFSYFPIAVIIDRLMAKTTKWIK